jgi:hypothetical protein
VGIESKPKLAWFPELGRGYYPVKLDGQYGKSYWDDYARKARTEIGRALNNARVELVYQHVGYAPVADIGIGSGTFIETRNTECRGVTRGYDVNTYAIRWLLDGNLWHDPYFIDPENATCWDSLEHMKHPEVFVRRVRRFLFISIPIFKDEAHALRSKHFKPKEHFHYFTEDGLIRWMNGEKFSLVTKNRMESDLGREDIGTFVFERAQKAD